MSIVSPHAGERTVGAGVDALTALVGCVTLLPGPRIAASLRWKLVASTVLTIAFMAVQLSPFGELVRVWMLD